MTNTMHRHSVLSLCAALLSLPACSTEEVGPPGYAYVAARLGLREIPTAALPTPPVEQLAVGYSLSDAQSPLIPPADMVIAPLYLSADGNFLALFE